MPNRFLSLDGCFQLTSSSKEDILKSFQELRTQVHASIESLKAVAAPTWENLIVPFYKTQTLIEHFGNRMAAIYVYSISNDEYQEAYGEIFSDYSELETILFASAPIIEKVAKLKTTAEYQTFDQEQKNYIQNILNKAKNQGTLTEDGLKQTISELNREISDLAQAFNSNIQKATQAAGIVVTDIADLGDMPQQWVSRASEHFNKKFNDSSASNKPSTPNEGPWFISLMSGVYEPFMEHSRNRSLKKDIYTQKRQLASFGEFDNSEIILKLIEKRKQLAQLRGFKNFLENSLEFTTANASQLEELNSSLSGPFKKKHQQLQDLYRKAARQDGIESLEVWDLALYERLHKESLGFNKEEFTEYFPYPEVKKAIFKIFEDCFSIQLKEATKDVSSWHPDVEFYRVIDNDGTDLGGFYVDPYQRAGEKIVGTQNVGAFCASLRESSLDNQKNVRPIGTLSFGFPPPTKDVPSLLQPEELGFFFHEFGHMFAILLKKQSDKTISPSFYLENDTIEFESMMLECWAQVPYVIKRISKHYKTGQPLSESKIEMLKDFLAKDAHERAHQLLGITTISLALYSTFDPAKDDLKSVVGQLVKEVFAAPYFEEDKFVWGCTPLFTLNGYLANTYMYLWAMTVAHTYKMEIESMGWNDDSIKKFGETLKTTLYRHAAVGRPMHALKLATGKNIPDFQGFAASIQGH